MSIALRTLLSGVIDYAGLFPPAKLPLEEALRNYARYRQEPDAWMLGRFICPAARLKELAPFVDELFASGLPLAVSSLGRGGNGLQQFRDGLLDDLKDISAFRDRHGNRARVDAFEVRLPGEGVFLHSGNDLRQLLFNSAQLLKSPQLPPLPVSYEAAPAAWRLQVETIVTTTEEMLESCRPCGLKLRCGGLEATAFPSPEQVAFTIIGCRDARLPLKFTAGLHHPLRHFDAPLQTMVHGFLNVFVAAVLANVRGSNEEQVRQIIEDEDASHFAFADAGLRWKDLHATCDEIITARREAVTSLGSCSFDEPRDDLRALGLLK